MTNNIKQTINDLQMMYQMRYVNFLKRYIENNADMDSHGHAMECSYILINVFGLTQKEMRELEKNNYAGLLDSDLED